MDLFDGQAIPRGGQVMPDVAGRAGYYVAGCGWATVVVGGQ